MKHKLLPALIGSMLTAGPLLAHAQVSVTLYGTADVQLENVKTSGSANPAQDKPQRWRLSNVSSDLGVKGSIPLSDSMTGLFQYQTGVSVDNASANTSAGLWGSAKDSYVGVSFANVGTLKFGRLTGSARWNSGTPDFSPMGAGPQDDQAALAGASGQVSALFNVRLDNALGFESASWNGLSARAYFGANENRSNAIPAAGAALDDKSYSLGAQYVISALDVRASYEIRNDKGTLNATTANSTKDKDYRIGVRYRFPTNTTVGFGYDRMSFVDTTATGTAKSYLKKTGWVIGVKQELDKHVVYGGYGSAGNFTCNNANGSLCDGTDTGMKQFVVAYNYIFNKQMLFEAYLSQLSNQARGKYDFDSGGVSPGTGAKLSAFGIGLRYSF